MNKPAHIVYREVVEHLNKFKEKHFPLGTIVSVDCDRFKGAGVSVGKMQECPPDRLAVRVQSGNVWFYPIESVDHHYGPAPEWIGEMVKEPWWIAFSRKSPAAVALGALGGKAGRGASKRRTSEHYRQAALKRWRKRDNQAPSRSRQASVARNVARERANIPQIP